MTKMKRRTEEAVQKNEQEMQALRRENEEMKKRLTEGRPSMDPPMLSVGPSPLLPT